jgi:hypothetical protein
MAGRKSAMYGSGADTALTPVVVLPATSGNAAAGYSPELLDELITTLIQDAEGGARLIGQYKPALQNLMQRLQSEVTLVLSMIPQATRVANSDGSPRIETEGLETALRLADKITMILDRVNKMVLNSVKSIDDGTRLRKDLATGDTERKRLEDLGEQQLRKIIQQASEGNFKSDGV